MTIPLVDLLKAVKKDPALPAKIVKQAQAKLSSPSPAVNAAVVGATAGAKAAGGGITPEKKAEYNAAYNQIQESGQQPTKTVIIQEGAGSPDFSGIKPIPEKPKDKSVVQNITDTVGGFFGAIPVLGPIVVKTAAGISTKNNADGLYANETTKYGTFIPKKPAFGPTLQNPPTQKTVQTIQQFQLNNPGANIPAGSNGQYDVVITTKRNIALPTQPLNRINGNITNEKYTFKYSDAAKHKIKIAGSTENYDRYLDIVRNNQMGLIGAHVFKSFLNVDLALASTQPGITGASEREEILIKHLHDWKGSPESKGDLGRMAGAILENPFVQIAGAEAGGMVAGKVLGGVGGRIAARYGPKAVTWFNRAQIVGGGALAAPGVYDIYQTAKEGNMPEAAGKGVMFPLFFAAGIQGFKEGGSTQKIFWKNKGLTPYESGYKQGMIRSKRFDPLQKEYYNIMTEIKQDLRLRNVKPVQEEPTFQNVRALAQYNKQKAETLRTIIKNQLIALKSRAQISGGAGTEKVSTGDIDELFRSAKNPVVLSRIARKLGIDPDMVFDPHQLPSQGSIVTRSGAPKEVPYVYPSRTRGIRLTEQFYRLSDSSIELAHSGRQKDIPEAQRILDLIYKKSGGIPKDMRARVDRFNVLSNELALNPRVMKPAESDILYNSNLSQKFWDLRTKFYEKTLSKNYIEKQFAKLSDFEKNAFRDMAASIGSRKNPYLPPSVSISYNPFVGFGSFSILFRNRGGVGSGGSGSSGGSAGGYGGSGSSSGSRSGSGSSGSSGGSAGGYGGSGSSSGSRSGSGSSGSSGGSRSSPSGPSFRGSSGYSRSSSGYGSSGGSRSGYRSSGSGSGFSRSASSGRSRSGSSGSGSGSSSSSTEYSPPSPPPFFFPGIGGRAVRRGHQEPYHKKYYNEYETIQELMRGVIF